ncbi:HAD-like domain-containing protein [Mycena floridula]|nr:HAD-like domain-containing protein [Mycena floridula]
MPLKAVIFDIGGVVARSPFVAISQYECDHGLPENYINGLIMASGHQGAWQKFERGEMDLFSFYEGFTRDLSDAQRGNDWYRAYCRRKHVEIPPLPSSLKVDGRELFGSMMRAAGTFDPHIVNAIQRIKAHGKHKVIALTNNFSKQSEDPEHPIPQSELEFLGWESGATTPQLVQMFDDFCDSSVERKRKPDPDFYLIACRRNGLQPQDCIFLDDIKMNLKPAMALGMETIHVRIGATLEAVQELEAKLGIDLTTSVRDTDTVAKL